MSDSSGVEGIVETNWKRILGAAGLCGVAYLSVTFCAIVIGVMTGLVYGFFMALTIMWITWLPCTGFSVLFIFIRSRNFLWRTFFAVPVMALLGCVMVQVWQIGDFTSTYFMCAIFQATFAAFACALRKLLLRERVCVSAAAPHTAPEGACAPRK